MISYSISRKYARALLSLGQEDGMYGKYGEDLYEFADFCSNNEEFFNVISNKIFSLEDRKNVLEYVLGKTSFSDISKNFLRLILEKNRMGAVIAIAGRYADLTDEISGIIRADIITAKPLKDTALEKIAKTLSILTSKEVKVNVTENPALIGGIIVKTGDLVLDGSVKAQLDGLKESLKRGEHK